MLFTIPQAVDIGAEKHPRREAVRFCGQSLTYGELATRSGELACLLTDQGVRRHDRVGVLLEKSVETAVAIYGIMKAGAAYVPLDPAAPVARLAFTLRDCGIRHVVSQERQAKTLRGLAAEGADLECVVGAGPVDGLNARSVSWEEVREASDTRPPCVPSIDQDLAYIIYTSGSTGSPKGIMHTHASGLSFARWAAEAYSLAGTDRLSNQSPLHFDMSIFDFFAGAVAGATTVIIPDEYMKLPASYSKLLEDERISVFFTVPFALTQLLLRGVLEKRELDALRWVIFGGEIVPTKHLRALMKRWPQARFSNMYGPAETNGCTFWHVTPLPEDSDAVIPIGRECPNMEALVLGEEEQPVGPGETGELLMRGATLMLGYWGRPDLNEKAFYRHALPGGVDKVYYRTGDLVEILPDGGYRFLGRKDRQIKIRGYRIELDEVEAAIVARPEVEETAVYAIDAGHGPHIEALIRVKPGMHLETSVLVDDLRTRLPPYALPSRIDLADDFPRIASRKIDYMALRKQARDRVPPRADTAGREPGGTASDGLR